MRIIIAGIILLMLIPVSVWTEIVILKNGKVFEGAIVKEDDEQIELKTEYGVLTISKSDIEQLAKNVEELLKPTDELVQKARACYERALEVRDDPIAKNKELLKGKNFLYEAYDGCEEIRQIFPQNKYNWIDEKKRETLKLMKAFRCARVRVTEEHLKKAAYREKLSELKDNDMEGHYQLALWCEKEGLREQMAEELEKVIKLNPDHAEAREKLGYVKKEDKWVRKEKPVVEKPESPVEKSELPPPPKPLAFGEIVGLLKTGTVGEKLEAIEKLAKPPQDKAFQPLVKEFVKMSQDPEVYEAVKSVLPSFDLSKVVSSMKRIIKASKLSKVSSTARRDALTILCQVDNKEHVKFMAKQFIDKTKLLAKDRFKSEQERIQTKIQSCEIRSSIVSSPKKEAAIPLASKHLRPPPPSSTNPVIRIIRKELVRLMVDIGTEKAAEALVAQLISGTDNKHIDPVFDGLMAIGLPTVFMPLVRGLGQARLKGWSLMALEKLTDETTFGYEQEKWLDWWGKRR